jgi:hypothetical protein
MKKYRIVLLVFISNYLSFSQTTQSTELQNFAPKSPEAAAFLKYGEYPVDLSTGVPNISIPIYTLNAGNFQLPITLDYHASGIKVAQEATWVGLGWNLNFGAQLIVDVRDDSDEFTVGLTPKAGDVRSFMTNNPLDYSNQYYNNLMVNSWVKDIYNFSSPTVSGKFYYDSTTANNELVIFPPNAFKVELITNGFKIIDNYGNNYFFGNTKELSQNLGEHQSALYQSAWFVDKIETLNKETINFTYIDGGEVLQENFSEQINHTVTKQLGLCNLELPMHIETISSTQNILSRSRTISKKISEINYKNTKIVFNSSTGRLDYFDASALNNSPKKLDLIKIQNKNATSNEYQNIKDFQFVYSYFDSEPSSTISKRAKRLKLLKIIENSLSFDTPNETVFAYSPVSLPPKDSKSVDYYGYFNGKLNNTIIPHQTIVFSQHGVTTSYESIGNADRSINPLKIEAGILTSIKYPTKGFTTFEYEPNSYYGVPIFDKFQENIISGNLVQGIGITINNPNELPSPDGYTTICNTNNNCCCIQYLELPFMAINATGKLSFQINNLADGNIARTKYAYARVRVYDDSGQIYDSGKLKSTRLFTIDLNMNGMTTIVLEAYDNVMSIQNTYLKYYNNDLNTKNNLASGLRIKSITNSNFNDQIISKKIFDYSKTLETSKSSGLLINDKNAWFQTTKFSNYVLIPCIGDLGLGGNNWLETTTNSFKSNSITGIESNTIIYSEVTEKNINTDAISNGQIVSYFTNYPDYFQDRGGLMYFDNGYKRGKLKSKEIFKIAAGKKVLLNKTTNEYVEDFRRSSTYRGFKLFKNNHIQSEIIGAGITMPIALNQIYEPVGYNFSIPWFYQKSSENIDYFYDSNNVLQGSNTSKTNYFYDNSDHLQLTRTETVNSKNEVLKNINYYLDDLLTAPNMTNLKSQNRIAEVIKTENYNGTNLISSQNKIYKDWGNNLFLPEIIQTSIGNGNLENRIKFNLIDNTNGKPLEMQMEKGSPVVYIWGYNKTQPIAKIENMTYAQVATALGTDVTSLQNFNETNLPAINALRTSLPNAMISTYTHIPLVGVSTMTDPKGDVFTYVYDSFNRLQAVKDKNGNILSENQYNYKQ